MKKLVFILLFFSALAGNTQINLDSLWQIFNNENEADTTRLEAMWYIAYDGYLYNNPDSSLLLAGQMYDFAVEKGQKQYQAYALGTQAVACYYLGKMDSSIMYHQRSFAINRELNNYKAMAACYNNMANVYRSWGRHAEALDHFLLALKVYEKLGEKTGMSTIYGNIGSIYSDMADVEMAQIWYRRALAIKKETNDEIGIALLMAGLGSGHLELGNLDSAMYYQQESLKIRLRINNTNGIANSMKHIAEIYSYRNNLDSAMYYYQKSLTYYEPLNMRSGMMEVYLYMADIYERSSNYENAETYAHKALDLAQSSGSLDAQRDACFMLFKLYKRKGNFNEALKMHENYLTLQDSMDKEANEKAIIKQQFQYDYDKKTIADSLRHEDTRRLEQLKHEQETEKQWLITVAVGTGLALVVVFLIFVFNRLQVTRKQKKVIEEQKIEVEQQKAEVELAHHELEEKNQEIMDSITYAKRIQSAILPSAKVVKEYLPDSFILYKPKAIVAGDFYWLESCIKQSNSSGQKNLVLFAAADCTGHGVPGAMVSVICNGALNRAVREFGLCEPGETLNKAREIVIQEFEKSDEEVKDGMDISLVALQNEGEGRVLKWAGANNPLWIIRKGASVVEEYKPEKQPIGKYADPKPFTTHTISVHGGDSIYIFTDGYQDQFGGDKGKKFKASSLKNLLLSIQHESMEKQKTLLDTTFENWRGKLEQIDDVCVIGVRV